MSGSRPWSLVFFTVLAQMAVGALVVPVCFGLLTPGEVGEMVGEELGAVALLTIGLTLACAVLAATFHLGRPGRAHRVLRNLGSSWLSREVVLGVMFGLLFVTLSATHSLGLGSASTRGALGIASALIGLALVAAMSRIYMLRTVPAWNTAATPISFFITAILLGALAFGAQIAVASALAGGPDRDLATGLVGWIALTSATLAAMTLVTTFLHGVRLRRLGGAAAESYAIAFQDLRPVLVMRAVLAVVGVGIFALATVWSSAGIAVLGFVLVLGGEILGRLLFFAAHRRVGL